MVVFSDQRMMPAHADVLKIIEGVAAATQDPTLSVRVPAATALADSAAAYHSAETPGALPEVAVPILMAGVPSESACSDTPACQYLEISLLTGGHKKACCQMCMHTSGLPGTQRQHARRLHGPSLQSVQG